MVKITLETPEQAASRDQAKEQELRERIENDEIPPAPREKAKRLFLGAKEIVLSAEVQEQLKEQGISPDEFVANLLKQFGAAQ